MDQYETHILKVENTINSRMHYLGKSQNTNFGEIGKVG